MNTFASDAVTTGGCRATHWLAELEPFAARLAASAVLLMTMSTAAAAYDFQGPPVPRDADDCRQHFNSLDRELSADLRRMTEACGPSGSSERFLRCWNPLSRQFEQYRQHSHEGAMACYARARKNQQEAREREAARQAELERERERQQREARAAQQRQADQLTRQREQLEQQRQIQATRAQQEAQRQMRQAQQLQGAAALGAIANQLLQDLTRARVEEELGAGAPNEVSQAAADNAARAFDIFKKARERMRTNRVVKAFQDLAWSHVDSQVKVIAEQIANIDRAIGAVLVEAPALSTVEETPNRRPLRAALVFGRVTMDYFGQVNDAGQPHGLGVAEGVGLTDGGRYRWYGPFEDGQPRGVGTLEDEDKDGLLHTTIAKFDGSRTAGYEHLVKRDLKSGRSSEHVGEFRDGGVQRIKFMEGTVYEGQVDRDGNPKGFGAFAPASGSKLFGEFNGSVKTVARAWRQAGGADFRCELFDTVQRQCFGAVRSVFPDGTVFYRHIAAGGVVTYPRVRSTPARAGQPGFIDEMEAIEGEVEIGRRTWEDGRVYEGEFKRGNPLHQTVGRLVSADGTIFAGRWEGGALEDGVRTEPDGSRSRLGAGTVYPIRAIANR